MVGATLTFRMDSSLIAVKLLWHSRTNLGAEQSQSKHEDVILDSRLQRYRGGLSDVAGDCIGSVAYGPHRSDPASSFPVNTGQPMQEDILFSDHVVVLAGTLSEAHMAVAALAKRGISAWILAHRGAGNVYVSKRNSTQALNWLKKPTSEKARQVQMRLHP